VLTAIGLPGDPGDVGNWGYWVGTVSHVVEAALVIVSLGMLWSQRKSLWRLSRLRAL
jgi:hypothetical protein